MPERTPRQKALELVEEEAYEWAVEEGLIRYLPATRIDPGCYSADLDIDFTLHEGGDDDMTGEAKVWLGSHVILERTYSFWEDNDGYLRMTSEDV